MEDPKTDSINKMIAEEMLAMIVNDNSVYPTKGMKEIKKPLPYEEVDPILLCQAKELVEKESSETELELTKILAPPILDDLADKKVDFFPGTKEVDYVNERTIAEQIEA